MKYKYFCQCGAKYMLKLEIRQHIAIQTLDWPHVRCTSEHHDINNNDDVEYVTRHAPTSLQNAGEGEV